MNRQIRTVLLKVAWWLDTPSVITSFKTSEQLHGDTFEVAKICHPVPQFYALDFSSGTVGMLTVKHFFRSCQFFPQMHCCLMEGYPKTTMIHKDPFLQFVCMSWPLEEIESCNTYCQMFLCVVLAREIKLRSCQRPEKITNCHDKWWARSSVKIKSV